METEEAVKRVKSALANAMKKDEQSSQEGLDASAGIFGVNTLEFINSVAIKIAYLDDVFGG